MLATAAIISASSGLGYLLPTLIGLESLGVPSPGETALVLAAVLASQGKLNIVLVIAIAAASATSATTSVTCSAATLAATCWRPAPVPRASRQGDRDRRPLLREARSQDRVHRPLDSADPLRHRLAGRYQRDAAADVFRLERDGRHHLAITYGVAGYYGGEAVAARDGARRIVAAGVLVVAIIVGVVYAKLRERRFERTLEDDG